MKEFDLEIPNFILDQADRRFYLRDFDYEIFLHDGKFFAKFTDSEEFGEAKKICLSIKKAFDTSGQPRPHSS